MGAVNGCTSRTQRRLKQHHGHRAVDVVVAVDQHGFVSLDGVFETRDGLTHAEHQIRFVQLIVTGCEKRACGAFIGRAAIDEECGQNR